MRHTASMEVPGSTSSPSTGGDAQLAAGVTAVSALGVEGGDQSKR
jgi:hypothetical protein